MRSLNEHTKRTESVESFTVVGLTIRANRYDDFAPIWSDFQERAPEVGLTGEEEFYGVWYELDYDNKEFTYLAGVRKSDADEIPDDFESIEIPADTYAVFDCDIETYNDTMDNIYDEWLPESDFVSGDGTAPGDPAYERYPADFNSEDPEETFDMYVPIQKEE